MKTQQISSKAPSYYAQFLVSSRLTCDAVDGPERLPISLPVGPNTSVAGSSFGLPCASASQADSSVSGRTRTGTHSCLARE